MVFRLAFILAMMKLKDNYAADQSHDTNHATELQHKEINYNMEMTQCKIYPFELI